MIFIFGFTHLFLVRLNKESNIKCEWKQRFATRIMLFYCLFLNTSGFNCFLRCLFWYEINSFWLTVSDHLAGNISKGLVTSHICWLRPRVPHHVPLWYWELIKVIGTITSGAFCPWLDHGLYCSGNLLSEIKTATSHFYRAFLMYPVRGFRFTVCFCSVSLMFSDKRQ